MGTNTKCHKPTKVHDMNEKLILWVCVLPAYAHLTALFIVNLVISNFSALFLAMDNLCIFPNKYCEVKQIIIDSEPVHILAP